MRWPWDREKEDIECERLTKYSDNKIEMAGLNVSDLQSGKLHIDSDLLQSATQSLLLLDNYQYSLCLQIKKISDIDLKEKYTKSMIEAKLMVQNIYRALAALSLDPENKVLHDTIKNMLLSSLGSVAGIEVENIEMADVAVDKTTEKSYESMDSFKKTFENLKQSYPETNKSIILISGNIKVNLS
jgi:hypothetical protein